MLKFAANISTMFQEYAFPDRISAAAEAGFMAVECQWPYETPHEVLGQKLHEAGIELILLNAPAGDWAGGDRGLAAVPDRQNQFKDAIARSIEYALALDCLRVHVLAGVSNPDNRALYIENIRYAAQQMGAYGISLLIEPINTKDVPGYFLNTSEQGLALLADIECPNVSLQYDIYHSFRMGENIFFKILKENINQISHIQLSDYPGRHEPGTGEIDYATLFAEINKSEYEHWIGCEYTPKGDTITGLSWMDKLLW